MFGLGLMFLGVANGFNDVRGENYVDVLRWHPTVVDHMKRYVHLGVVLLEGAQLPYLM